MNASLFESNSDRSGSNHMAGITQNVPLGSIALLRLGYAYDTDSTREDFWDYEGHKGSAGMQVILPAGFSIDLSGEYYWKDYEDNDPSVSDETREDETGTVAISITKTLSDIFSITIGQLYMNNQSNIDAYDYERAITSLFINARF
jgi:hypothetical protein